MGSPQFVDYEASFVNLVESVKRRIAYVKSLVTAFKIVYQVVSATIESGIVRNKPAEKQKYRVPKFVGLQWSIQ